MKSFVCLRLFALLALLIVVGQAAPSAEFSNAAQPQIATSANGRVWLAFGRGTEIFVAASKDGAATFGEPVRVATLPRLALGMRRGPRIAASGDRLTVTANAQELISLHSADGGKTWSEPVTINEVATSAREGLHDLAASPDGMAFVTWLDLRNGKTELWGAESKDGGRTWGPNQQVYRSPDQTICECCHPTALYDAEGNLAVMWRNSIQGTRDMWLATRAKGASTFAPAKKLGEGTWTLKGCPMDGGRIVALGGGKFASVWQREGEIFYAPAEGRETLLGKGKQPVAIQLGADRIVFWQQGPELWTSRPGKSEAARFAADARFPVLMALPSSRGAVIAYEQGPAKAPMIVVERL